jgi:hypothetical protein
MTKKKVTAGKSNRGVKISKSSIDKSKSRFLETKRGISP